MGSVVEMSKRKASFTPRKRITCKLQDFLDAERLTQSELAEETGLAISTIGSYCRSQINRIDVLTAEVLCERFKTDMCGLFPVTKEPIPTKD